MKYSRAWSEKKQRPKILKLTKKTVKIQIIHVIFNRHTKWELNVCWSLDPWERWLWWPRASGHRTHRHQWISWRRRSSSSSAGFSYLVSYLECNPHCNFPTSPAFHISWWLLWAWILLGRIYTLWLVGWPSVGLGLQKCWVWFCISTCPGYRWTFLGNSCSLELLLYGICWKIQF